MGFKISIPFNTILFAEAEDVLSPPQPADLSASQGENASAELTAAIIHLAQYPALAVNDLSLFQPWSKRGWRLTDDWTEGQQATSVLQHHLEGPSVFIRHLVDFLNRQVEIGDPLQWTLMPVDQQLPDTPSQVAKQSDQTAVPSGLEHIPSPQNVGVVEGGLPPRVFTRGNWDLLFSSDVTLSATSRPAIQQELINPAGEDASPYDCLIRDGYDSNQQPRVLPGFYEHPSLSFTNLNPELSGPFESHTSYTRFTPLGHNDPLDLDGIPTVPDAVNLSASHLDGCRMSDVQSPSAYRLQHTVLSLSACNHGCGQACPVQDDVFQWEPRDDSWPEDPAKPREPSSGIDSAYQGVSAFAPGSKASSLPLLGGALASPISANQGFQIETSSSSLPAMPRTPLARTHKTPSRSAPDGVGCPTLPIHSNLLDDLLKLQQNRRLPL